MDTFSERDPEAVESPCIQARRADAQREQRHQVLGRLVGHVPLPHRSDRSVTQPCAAAPLVRLNARQLGLEDDSLDLHDQIGP